MSNNVPACVRLTAAATRLLQHPVCIFRCALLCTPTSSDLRRRVQPLAAPRPCCRLDGTATGWLMPSPWLHAFGIWSRRLPVASQRAGRPKKLDMSDGRKRKRKIYREKRPKDSSGDAQGGGFEVLRPIHLCDARSKCEHEVYEFSYRATTNRNGTVCFSSSFVLFRLYQRISMRSLPGNTDLTRRHSVSAQNKASYGFMKWGELQPISYHSLSLPLEVEMSRSNLTS